jgi:4-alpha-glucanotransferase
MGSVACLFVAQLQDYLGLGEEGRINVPGVGKGNWEWRLRAGQLPKELAGEIRALTATYSRCAPKEEKPSAGETAPVETSAKDTE